MKTLPLILFILLAFQANAQEGKGKPQSSLLLYPEVYQIAKVELSEAGLLSDLVNFCDAATFSLIEVEKGYEIMRIYPQSVGAELAAMNFEDQLNKELEGKAKVVSIKSYGREYLPQVYVNQISKGSVRIRVD
ncbi:hypothetical protein Belba_0699 [Belliella baltica DSM 15883]|uniref:Uncharacterized protein n=1 Tax=Belliella baltica (strain DSM 15883 / CIP 108006 / LMG 21964 / BA134) TaxID=866536 RepID=I3Z286_BELBD|nr:hypothetical protein [Belliella baltica]AFL83354.1 hypothetical protein Belba_0699 [Belliella baltica DSM 15883]